MAIVLKILLWIVIVYLIGVIGSCIFTYRIMMRYKAESSMEDMKAPEPFDREDVKNFFIVCCMSWVTLYIIYFIERRDRTGKPLPWKED